MEVSPRELISPWTWEPALTRVFSLQVEGSLLSPGVTPTPLERQGRIRQVLDPWQLNWHRVVDHRQRTRTRLPCRPAEDGSPGGPGRQGEWVECSQRPPAASPGKGTGRKSTWTSVVCPQCPTALTGGLHAAVNICWTKDQWAHLFPTYFLQSDVILSFSKGNEAVHLVSKCSLITSWAPGLVLNAAIQRAPPPKSLLS